MTGGEGGEDHFAALLLNAFMDRQQVLLEIRHTDRTLAENGVVAAELHQNDRWRVCQHVFLESAQTFGRGVAARAGILVVHSALTWKTRPTEPLATCFGMMLESGLIESGKNVARHLQAAREYTPVGNPSSIVFLDLKTVG